MTGEPAEGLPDCRRRIRRRAWRRAHGGARRGDRRQGALLRRRRRTDGARRPQVIVSHGGNRPARAHRGAAPAAAAPRVWSRRRPRRSSPRTPTCWWLSTARPSICASPAASTGASRQSRSSTMCRRRCGHISPAARGRWRGIVDRVLAILPFEPEVHRELGGPPCTYVGHPLLAEIPSLSPAPGERTALGDGGRPVAACAAG